MGKGRVMKKKVFVIMLGIMLFFSSTLISMAENLKQEVAYDLQKGGVQEFQLTDKEGDIYYVIVEEVEEVKRVADGAYKISFNAPGLWMAGFFVRISNNQIKSAYSPFYQTVVGNILSPSLILNSSVEANYKFVYKNLLSFSTGVRAKMSSSELKISKI